MDIKKIRIVLMLHSGAFINKTEHTYKTYKNEKYRQEVDQREGGFSSTFPAKSSTEID